MSKKINPLQKTASELHLAYTIGFAVNSKEQWYGIIHECQNWFGSNWSGQSRVLRKFKKPMSGHDPILVAFKVPDARIASWITIKHAITVVCIVKNPNK